MSLTKTDRAWGILFERYQIVRKVEEHGYFVIAAKQIREEREPRSRGLVERLEVRMPV